LPFFYFVWDALTRRKAIKKKCEEREEVGKGSLCYYYSRGAKEHVLMLNFSSSAHIKNYYSLLLENAGARLQKSAQGTIANLA
jgi:hypothetical protein